MKEIHIIEELEKLLLVNEINIDSTKLKEAIHKLEEKYK